MKRRNLLKFLGLSGCFYSFSPSSFKSKLILSQTSQKDEEIKVIFDVLKKEETARAEVKTERGGPRLFINGEEIYPLFALSVGLLKTAEGYKNSEINLLAPLLGLNAGWLGPYKFYWADLENYLVRLLAIIPNAYLLPRLQLNTPHWWKDAHPEEIIKYGMPLDKNQFRLKPRIGEGGMNWNALNDLYDVSLASRIWLQDAGDLLTKFLRYMERSPLRSRIIGYQVAGAMNGEWHYIGSRYLPDYSLPMQKACGSIPQPEDRIKTTYGLLRDPEHEKSVIEYYQKFHQTCADSILDFAEIVKKETQRRILCGAFYTYLLENICIQEAGHLAPQKILESPDIDFIPCPYSYQHTNIPEKERWESDIVDDAGNWLGRARGVGGDGGYRVLTESLKRHNKLFIVEMDPLTYIEPVKRGEGGSGYDSLEGTLRIIRRDLGRMFSHGVGGWLFDFGHLVPPYKASRGWYDDKPVIEEIKKFADLGKKRKDMNISSAAEILAVYDASSFCATQHWKEESPWKGYGIAVTDFFNHWFLNSQSRTLHRIGAPVDFIYRFDLKPENIEQYKLIFMVNLFYLEENEVEEIKQSIERSNKTVVWFYAPGFINPQKLDLDQMESLTGFHFKLISEPGPMMIRSMIQDRHGKKINFGVKKHYFPRFSVEDKEVEKLGIWDDQDLTAFAWKTSDKHNSVYTGCAPLPVEILRWLAERAGVSLWSTKPDIITASQDAATVIASEKGERLLTFPKEMKMMGEELCQKDHHLFLEFGDVKLFLTND